MLHQASADWTAPLGGAVFGEPVKPSAPGICPALPPQPCLYSQGLLLVLAPFLTGGPAVELPSRKLEWCQSS